MSSDGVRDGRFSSRANGWIVSNSQLTCREFGGGQGSTWYEMLNSSSYEENTDLTS